jgi:hypothetical protein
MLPAEAPNLKLRRSVAATLLLVVVVVVVVVVVFFLCFDRERSFPYLQKCPSVFLCEVLNRAAELQKIPRYK